MNNPLLVISTRAVRSLHSNYFRAPWPFVKKGAIGQRKIGPVVFEKHKWPGQDREFPELNPKFQKLNPEELHRYTGVQPVGYKDPITGEFVKVPEMIPEIVVPDLAGFQLKPYVSYRTDVEIEKRRAAYEQKVMEKGSEELADLYVVEDERWPPPKMNAKTMFDLFYADNVRKSYADGKYGDTPTTEGNKKSDEHL
uniref:39S ribosomal protein L41, mitochondrial n=1 Tax=Steinernema glaseri TaxID=37863 RepID=A0A1I7YB11_9BILA